MALDHALPRNDQKFGLSFVKLKAASTECNPRWIGFLYQHPCSLSFQPCCYYGVSTQSAGRLYASCIPGIPCLVEMTKSSRNAVHLVPVGPVLRGMPSHVQRDAFPGFCTRKTPQVSVKGMHMLLHLLRSMALGA